MKKFIIITLISLGFFASLYFWNQQLKKAEQHPEIHSQASKPDDYLIEALDYEAEDRHAKSAIKIEQAIQAIWKLEKEVDDESFDHLERAIQRLETTHRKMVREVVSPQELLTAIEYALGNLAHVELKVAAKYTESNQLMESRTAIKYAQLHLKNILILHSPNFTDESGLLSQERHLLNRIDSLSSQQHLSKAEYLEAIDKMLKEVDEILKRIEEK